MGDIQYINGLIVKAPNDKAPEYVKAKLSIKREDLISWLQGQDGEWINAEIKESKGGKWYCAVDAWKPNGEQSPRQESKPREASFGDAATGGFEDDSIPFQSIPRRQLW
jgi:hypothetical protein